MFSYIRKINKKTSSLRFLSNFKHMTYWDEKDNIYTLKLNPSYKRVIKDISINPKDYVKFDEELIYLNIDNYVNYIHSPFDCRIIKKNHNILDDLKCEFQHSSSLWIVKIEPVKFNNNYILFYEKFIQPNQTIQLHELVCFG